MLLKRKEKKVWKASVTKPKPKLPKIGDKKTESRFAWFPVKLNSESLIWLEKYNLHYEFKETKKTIVVVGNNRYEDGYTIGRKNHKSVKIETWVLIEKTANRLYHP